MVNIIVSTSCCSPRGGEGEEEGGEKGEEGKGEEEKGEEKGEEGKGEEVRGEGAELRPWAPRSPPRR